MFLRFTEKYVRDFLKCSFERNVNICLIYCNFVASLVCYANRSVCTPYCFTPRERLNICTTVVCLESCARICLHVLFFFSS